MSFLTGTQAELLYAMPATGGSVTGTVSTASTNILTPTMGATLAPYQLPAYFFSNSGARGTSLLIQGGGTLLNGATTQTMRFALYYNQTTQGVQGTLLAATGLFSPFGTTVSQTGTFMFEVLCTATNTGTAGTLNTIGRLAIGPGGANTGTNVGNVTMLMNNSTQPVFDNSKPAFIEAYAHFGATTTTQAATLTNFLVWGLN
jgi:hypothetical protein